MKKISFLGACGEVGASGILVDTEKEKILIDYGLKLQEKPLKYPKEIDEKLNAVIISHAHLDHMGAIPSLYSKGQIFPCIGQEITKDFSKILWKDSIKIAKNENEELKFTEKDVKKALKKYQISTYRKTFKIGKARITTFDAGHIPGSAMVMIENSGKKVLYSGDFNDQDTRLINGCDLEIPNVDILIIESTYADKEHPNRKNEERRILESIYETLENDGIAIIASFAISRAQEILLVLEKYGIKVPVYIDGMAEDSTKIINKYPNLQKEYNSVKNAISKMGVKFIEHPNQRKKVLKKSCIIITPSGMLTGGSVVYYIKKLHKREDCSLILTGFQVPGTEGYNLLKTGRYTNEEIDVKLNMNVKKFDFSAHASRRGLLKLIETTAPKRVFCIHGEHTEKFAKELESMGYDASSPKLGEIFNL